MALLAAETVAIAINPAAMLALAAKMNVLLLLYAICPLLNLVCVIDVTRLVHCVINVGIVFIELLKA